MVADFKEKTYLSVIYIVLFFVGAAALIPLLYVMAVSVTPYSEVLKNQGILIIPTRITLEGYRAFLADTTIPRAYYVSGVVTLAGTMVNLVMTLFIAYPLSKKDLPGRDKILLAIVFTMLFSGGLVPTYLIVRDTGLINSLWSLIIPTMISTYNLLIMKSFFQNIPESMGEAARIDGAGELRIMMQIVLPLSLPVLTTIGLFYAVNHWNTFLPAVMYINDSKKFPLQVVLRNILAASLTDMPEVEETLPTETMRMSAVILTAAPIVVIYPFIQKYFTKGVLLGSIKG